MIGISIQASDPLTIQAQIVEQIQYSIALGLWEAGYRLPPVREMAAMLQVNYHTVRAAYQALEQAGYVETARGRGTYVVQHPPYLSERQGELLSFIDTTLYQAHMLGIPAPVFARAMHTRSLQLVFTTSEARILLIECNNPDLIYHAQTIEKYLGVRPDIIELKDVEQQDTSFFAHFTLIATTFYHIAELREMIHTQQPILGLSVSPSYSQTLQELITLPRDASVGLICATVEKAEGMKRDLQGHGIIHVHFQTGAIDQKEQIEQLFQQSTLVYVSRLGLSLQQKQWPQTAVVRPYVTHLDSAALGLLRSQLQLASSKEKA